MAKSTASPRTETVDLPENERYRLLANERRRVVLEVLSERTPPRSITELVTAVAERESGEKIDTGEIRISLHHVHLPMMAELGIVDYDSEANRIEPGHTSTDSYLV